MNCIEHEDRNAVSTCAHCGVGLCKECEDGSVFRSGTNQAFCKKCNYETACENDRIFNRELRAKKIIMYIYIGAIVIGLISFGVSQASNSYSQFSVWIMLLCWSLGSISNIFDSNSWIRKYLRYIGNSFDKIRRSGSFPFIIGGLIGTIIGTILGFAIMGAFSPIIIIVCLFAIGKVKKQIANNDAILSRFGVEDDQQQAHINEIGDSNGMG